MVVEYNEIMKAKDAMYSDGFKEMLEDMGLKEVFGPLFGAYSDIIAKKVVLFIVSAYSYESPLITVNGDRSTEKGNIFRSLNFPHKDDDELDLLYKAIVNMQEWNVVQSCTKWLERQGNEKMLYLITLQDTYAQMQTGALSPIRRADGTIDYDQKQRCIEYMTSLQELIQKARASLMQNDVKFKGIFHEVKVATEKSNKIGAETFARR